MIRHPLRVPMPMDQDFRQLGNLVGVPVVLKEMRSRPDELRRYRGCEQQNGGCGRLPYKHGWIVAHLGHRVKPAASLCSRDPT